MYCQRCGAYNDEQALYCARCGTPLGDAPPPPAQQPPPYPPPGYAPPPAPRYAPEPAPPRAPSGYVVASAPPERVGPVGVLLFCFPLAGAVMYFVWKDQHPEKAQRACWLALGGTALGIVLQLIASLAQS